MADVKLTPRNIRDLCLGKVDPQVVRVLEAIVDAHQQQERAMVEFARLLDQCVNLMNQLNLVAEGMQKATDKLNKIKEGDQYERPDPLKL